MVYPEAISGLGGMNGTTYCLWAEVLKTRMNKGFRRGFRSVISYVSLPVKGNRSGYLTVGIVDLWLVRDWL